MIILPHEESKLLTRELLYVAASRAKRKITFVGDPKAFWPPSRTRILPFRSCPFVGEGNGELEP